MATGAKIILNHGRRDRLGLAIFRIVLPAIEIDSAGSSARWGEQFVSLTPGKHRITVYVPYFRIPKLGWGTTPRAWEASIDIEVAEGEIAVIDYLTNVFVTWPGRIQRLDL